jgi:thymidylate synthase ThyX
VTFSATVIKDSISPFGVRLTTLEVVLPRFVAVDFNTHRSNSRNGASSRAIPIEKRIAAALNDPFIPARFTKNCKGMAATEYLTGEEHARARAAWLKARDNAVESAREMAAIGVHKGLVNRLLEPFLWHKILVTATEWSNYDALRCHPDTQDEMRIPSEMMRDARAASTPRLLQPGEWHLPYVEDTEAHELGTDALYDSVGRCARISTLTHDGKRSPEADIALTTREMAAGHMSPAEHVACVAEHTGFIGNFRGWKQLRKFFPNEHDFGLILAARGAS